MAVSHPVGPVGHRTRARPLPHTSRGCPVGEVILFDDEPDPDAKPTYSQVRRAALQAKQREHSKAIIATAMEDNERYRVMLIREHMMNRRES